MSLRDAIGLGDRRARGAAASHLLRELGTGARVLLLDKQLSSELQRAGFQTEMVPLDPKRSAKRIFEIPLAHAAGSLDAACATADASLLAFGGPLMELVRVVRHNGRVLVFTQMGRLRRSMAREEVAGLLLHALLTDIQQLEIGSQLLTMGRVHRPTSAAA